MAATDNTAFAANHLIEMTKIILAVASNKRIMRALIRIFGEYDHIHNNFWATAQYQIFASIMKHPLLFERYASALAFEKHYDLIKALQAAQAGKFLIYFADLQLFATVMALKDLEMFMYNLRNTVDELNEDSTPDKKFKPLVKQIILTDTRQRLLFICENGPNCMQLVAQLQQYIVNQLGTTSAVEQTTDGVEITVDSIFDNQRVAAAKFDDLRAAIYDNNQPAASAMKSPLLHKTIVGNYIAADISAAVNIANADELARLMKSFPCGCILNVSIVINNGTNNTTTVNMCSNSQSTKSSTMAWVKANPPREREITTEYFDRYVTANDRKLASSQFGSVVKSEGYTTIKSTKHRLWTKVYKQ